MLTKSMDAEFTLISAGHAGYEVLWEEYWSRLIGNLRELTSYAEDLEMDLVLEPLTHYENNVLVTCNDLVTAINEIGSNRLFGMCDILHLFVFESQ